MKDLQIVYVDINQLKPAEYNPRKANKKQIEDIKKSIEKFGLVDPLIVNNAENRKNIVIGGHLRLKVAKDMGYKEVPVVYVNIPDIEKEKELNLRLNKNTGEFDFDLLANFDEDLLKDVGFESVDLDKIFDLDLETNPKDDEVPEIKKETNIRYGDVYQLGNHRIMCGDATKREDVFKLMNGEKADMVFTDPPYNVDYSGSGKNTKNKIKNDNMDLEIFKLFLDKAFNNIKYFSKSNSAIYICHADGKPFIRYTFEEVFNKYFKQSATLIWVKSNASMGYQHYRSKHEPILYGWNEEKCNFYGDRTNTTILEIKREINYTHPTQKPVDLIKKIILNSSKRGELVLDLFLGSGSTLIACEKVNRICYGMELEPLYIQVVIDRWEQLTGKKAVKL